MDLLDVRWDHGLGGSGSGNGEVADFFECGDEFPGSIKCRKFLE
jgi:hypothetical protein